MSAFDQIWTVEEAGRAWGLAPSTVKHLCQEGKVKSRKFGKTWLLIKAQANPAAKKKSPTA